MCHFDFSGLKSELVSAVGEMRTGFYSLLCLLHNLFLILIVNQISLLGQIQFDLNRRL